MPRRRRRRVIRRKRRTSRRSNKRKAKYLVAVKRTKQVYAFPNKAAQMSFVKELRKRNMEYSTAVM